MSLGRASGTLPLGFVGMASTSVAGSGPVFLSIAWREGEARLINVDPDPTLSAGPCPPVTADQAARLDALAAETRELLRFPPGGDHRAWPESPPTTGHLERTDLFSLSVEVASVEWGSRGNRMMADAAEALAEACGL